MKKILSLTIILLVLLCFSVNADVPSVIINGVPVAYNEDTGYPFIDENNRTMVPLRATMETAGFYVGYDENKQTAIIKAGLNRIEIPAWSNIVWVNNNAKENDTIAVIKDGRIYLPIRIVFESAEYTVEWDSVAQAVNTYTYNNYQTYRINYDIDTALYPMPDRYATANLKVSFPKENYDIDLDGIVDNAFSSGN